MRVKELNLAIRKLPSLIPLPHAPDIIIAHRCVCFAVDIAQPKSVFGGGDSFLSAQTSSLSVSVWYCFVFYSTVFTV